MKRRILISLAFLVSVSCFRPNPPDGGGTPTPEPTTPPPTASPAPTLVPPDCPPTVIQTCTPGWPDANPWHANVVKPAMDAVAVDHPEWFNHEKTNVLPPYRQQYDFAVADKIRVTTTYGTWDAIVDACNCDTIEITPKGNMQYYEEYALLISNGNLRPPNMDGFRARCEPRCWPVISGTPTAGPTATSTRTAIPTRTPTRTPIPTRTPRPTVNPTATASATKTGAPSATATGTSTSTPTSEPTPTPTGSTKKCGPLVKMGMSKLGDPFPVGVQMCQWYDHTARFINEGCPRNSTDGCPCNSEHHEYCEATCDVEEGGKSVMTTTSPQVLSTWQTIHLSVDPKNVYRGSRTAFCGMKGTEYVISADLEAGAINQKGQTIIKVPGFKPTVIKSKF